MLCKYIYNVVQVKKILQSKLFLIFREAIVPISKTPVHQILISKSSIFVVSPDFAVDL